MTDAGERQVVDIETLEPYRPLVRKVVSRRVPPLHVEDVVQETFRRAVSGLHKLRKQEALSAWLVRVAARAVADFHDRQSRGQEVSTGSETTEVITSEQAHDVFRYSYNKLMYKEIVRLLMERLDQDEKKILQLFYFDELSHHQVGEALGTSEQNVRVRLHRLRTRMRKLMAQYHDSVELFGL
jgi:RNA polymerase sigma-70 factor (ECF subfamily)